MNKTTRGLLIGTLSGALLGAGLAWVVLSMEKSGGAEASSQGKRRLQAQTGDWLRLGMSVLHAGRQLADMIRIA